MIISAYRILLIIEQSQRRGSGTKLQAETMQILGKNTIYCLPVLAALLFFFLMQPRSTWLAMVFVEMGQIPLIFFSSKTQKQTSKNVAFIMSTGQSVGGSSSAEISSSPLCQADNLTSYGRGKGNQCVKVCVPGTGELCDQLPVLHPHRERK